MSIEPSAGPDNGPTNAHIIESDLACRKCGYNLRGLHSTSRCPECHAELDRSLFGDDLRHCDPSWVLRLAAGMNWLCIATAVGAVFLVGSAIASALFGSPAKPEVRLAFSVLVATLALTGIGMVTARDPAGDERPSARRARWTLRIWVVGSMVLQIAFDLPWTIPTFWRLIIFLIQVALGLLGVFIFFDHARRLASRMPHAQHLDTETLAVMWGVIISYVLLAAIIAAAIIPGRVPDYIQWIFGLSCTVAVGCVVFTIWSITLLLRYRAALRQAAQSARETWKSD